MYFNFSIRRSHLGGSGIKDFKQQINLPVWRFLTSRFSRLLASFGTAKEFAANAVF
uniref:Uncharacterized protein n=1 Tax=Nelumbo nucifera TaxID=4432 RepID=A0A822Y3Q1_NELNU|nr:TPA_asm: hypothetical protein HUJ06_028668 [Nelumbo nucifera]